MKKIALVLIAVSTLLSGCVVHESPNRHRDRDRDRDGVSDRYDRDRDGDGIPNRYDRRPDDPRRY